MKFIIIYKYPERSEMTIYHDKNLHTSNVFIPLNQIYFDDNGNIMINSNTEISLIYSIELFSIWMPILSGG